MILMLIANIGMIYMINYPGIRRQTSMWNEEEIIEYLYYYFYQYYQKEGHYPQNMKIFPDSFPIDKEIISALHIETNKDSVFIKGKYFRTRKPTDTISLITYELEPGQKWKDIYDNNRYYKMYLLIIASLLILLFIVLKIRNTLKENIIFFTILVLLIIGISRVLFKVNKYDMIYAERHLLKKYAKEYIESGQSASNKLKYKSFITKKDFKVFQMDGNIIFMSPSPEYYVRYQRLHNSKKIIILLPLKLFSYDTYTDSFIKQYDEFTKYKYKNRVYIEIVLSGLLRTCKMICVILTIIITLILFTKKRKM